MNKLNFDHEAACIAQSIIKETENKESKQVENLVTKTLGVLEENGVYACMLYLCSRHDKEKEIAKVIQQQLLQWNEKIHLPKPEDTTEKNLKSVSDNICGDLDTLFLVKELWERTLIYARYGAKARRTE